MRTYRGCAAPYRRTFQVFRSAYCARMASLPRFFFFLVCFCLYFVHCRISLLSVVTLLLDFSIHILFVVFQLLHCILVCLFIFFSCVQTCSFRFTCFHIWSFICCPGFFLFDTYRSRSLCLLWISSWIHRFLTFFVWSFCLRSILKREGLVQLKMRRWLVKSRRKKKKRDRRKEKTEEQVGEEEAMT